MVCHTDTKNVIGLQNQRRQQAILLRNAVRTGAIYDATSPPERPSRKPVSLGVALGAGEDRYAERTAKLIQIVNSVLDLLDDDDLP